MSDSKRTLKINPDLFTLSGKKNKKEKTQKAKPIIDEENSSKTNKVKRELMKKVKNYQKNKEQEKILEEKKETNMFNNNMFEEHKFENSDFEREFNTSLNFLQDLAKKNKEKKRKKTLKNNAALEVQMTLPNNLNNNEPSYGCLKNGTKPTYTQLNKTQKNMEGRRIKIVLENNDSDTDYDSVQNKSNRENKDTTFNEIIDDKIKNLEEITEDVEESKHSKEFKDYANTRDPENSKEYNKSNSNSNSNSNLNINTNNLPRDLKNAITNSENNLNINEKLVTNQEEISTDLKNTDLTNFEEISYEKLPKLNRVTRKKKYKLGKIKGNKHVGILIKNRETQKNIKNEIGLLKTKSIQEIKDYLRQKNLIKVGTEAPNDVIRKMYEDSILSGDVENNNDSNMVHNFLNY